MVLFSCCEEILALSSFLFPILQSGKGIFGWPPLKFLSILAIPAKLRYFPIFPSPQEQQPANIVPNYSFLFIPFSSEYERWSLQLFGTEQ